MDTEKIKLLHKHFAALTIRLINDEMIDWEQLREFSNHGQVVSPIGAPTLDQLLETDDFSILEENKGIKGYTVSLIRCNRRVHGVRLSAQLFGCYHFLPPIQHGEKSSLDIEGLQLAEKYGFVKDKKLYKNKLISFHVGTRTGKNAKEYRYAMKFENFPRLKDKKFQDQFLTTGINPQTISEGTYILVGARRKD